MAKEKNQCDLPTFYIYEMNNEWRKTDKELTHKLNSPCIVGADWLAGRSFYPQWAEPEFKSQTRPAWRITPEGYKVVRCETRTRQHHKNHGNCHMINEHECEYTKAKQLVWSEKNHLWVLNNTNE